MQWRSQAYNTITSLDEPGPWGLAELNASQTVDFNPFNLIHLLQIVTQVSLGCIFRICYCDIVGGSGRIGFMYHVCLAGPTWQLSTPPPPSLTGLAAGGAK